MRAKGSKAGTRFPLQTDRNASGVAAGVRNQYADHPEGAPGWYRDHGATYRNPHAAAVSATVQHAVDRWPELFTPPGRILDFCCGSGEVTRALIEVGIDTRQIDATDPFTGDAFTMSCPGRVVMATWSFADVEQGIAQGHRWKTIICSYAFHLCERSRLAGVCAQLAAVTDHLVILTPHKRPELRESWGFQLAEELRDPTLRIRLRRYDRCP